MKLQNASRDPAAQAAGATLLLTAAFTIAAVVFRVGADADQGQMLDSLVAISASNVEYGIGGGARLLSGLTLLGAGIALLRTWIIRQRFGTPAVPVLFVLSGLLTAISGASATGLAVAVPESPAGIESIADRALTEASYELRWIAGKLGFAAAGLALMVAARYQWKAGATLRRIAPASAVLGLLMQLIWVDAATFVHPVTGVAFVAWLAAIGAMLYTGRVERHFPPRCR